MFIRTRRPFKTTYYYLSVSKRRGKTVRQMTVYIGNDLSVPAGRWLDILRAAGKVGPINLRDIFLVVERFVIKRAMSFESMAGLKEAMKIVVRNGPSYRELGLQPGASQREIQRAFRVLARVHHPDTGGDPAQFQAVVEAKQKLIDLVTTHPRGPVRKTKKSLRRSVKRPGDLLFQRISKPEPELRQRKENESHS